MTRLGVAKPVVELSFIACAIVDTTFAVPIARVREITQPMPLTRVPEAPPSLLGAVDHRGEVLPIVDVGLQMTGQMTLDVRRKWILIKHGDRTVGLVVRQVFEVFRTKETALRRAPEMGGAFGYTTRDVVTYDGNMAFVLDLEAVARLATTGIGPEDTGLVPISSVPAPRGSSPKASP